MDENIDKKFFFIAKVSGFRESVEHFSGAKIILENIIFEENNQEFRDHTWVNSSHRFKDIKKGDTIRFRGILYNYISSEGKKTGIKNIREVSKI